MSKSTFLSILLGVGMLTVVSCTQNNQEAPAASAPEMDESAIAEEMEEEMLEEAPADALEDEATGMLSVTEEYGSFTTFQKLLEAADMEQVLEKSQELTLLAPTDEAFAQLPAGTLEKWLDPQGKEELKAVLSNHILPDVYLSADLSDGKQTPTMSGLSLPVSKGENLKLGTSTIITADIEASNGVIHIVDQVILENQ